jgi:hypothetical protein
MEEMHVTLRLRLKDNSPARRMYSATKGFALGETRPSSTL